MFKNQHFLKYILFKIRTFKYYRKFFKFYCIIIFIIKLCDINHIECIYIKSNSKNINNSFNKNNNNNLTLPIIRNNNNNYLNYSNNYSNNNKSNKLFKSPPKQQQQQQNIDYQTNDFKLLQKIVQDGLNLTNLPDAKMANISQKEYYEKYKLYLEKLKQRNLRENYDHFNKENDGINYVDDIENLEILTFEPIHSQQHQYSYFTGINRSKRSINVNDLVFVRFKMPEDDLSSDIEESTLRLMINSHNSHKFTETNEISIKIYQLIEPYGRIWLDTYYVNLNSLNDIKNNKWIEFDVSRAIKNWLDGQTNLGFEIFCENCEKNGIHIIHDSSLHSNSENNPVLNIVSKLTHREKRSKQHQHLLQISKRKPRRTDCHKDNHKCCRHAMEVVFKEIKGFEFIIQPKVFDAGYCRGKCPARYNPAHHHALLQSLIWKQDKNKAPRPCCAPSKLVELEVLHVDEEDNTKLKVSTWSDMRVLECACS